MTDDAWLPDDPDPLTRRMWALAGELVETVGVRSGERVLDVACGTGSAALPAAAAGGVVTGLDISPKLLRAARRNAAAARAEIAWVEGDAQELPFDDGSFDVVLSVFGCMFAADHRATARELARVLAPGGRLAVLAWRPTPGDPAAERSSLWGEPGHVAELFDGTRVELRYEARTADWRFETTAELFDGVLDRVRSNRRAPGSRTRGPGSAFDCLEALRAQVRQEDDGVTLGRAYLLTQGDKPR